MLAVEGTFLEIGNYLGAKSEISTSVLLRGRKMIGSMMYRPSLLPKIVEFLVRVQNTLPFHKIVSHKFPLSAATHAFQESEWSGKETSVIRSALIP